MVMERVSSELSPSYGHLGVIIFTSVVGILGILGFGARRSSIPRRRVQLEHC
jgi:hypothetical protein